MTTYEACMLLSAKLKDEYWKGNRTYAVGIGKCSGEDEECIYVYVQDKKMKREVKARFISSDGLFEGFPVKFSIIGKLIVDDRKVGN